MNYNILYNNRTGQIFVQKKKCIEQNKINNILYNNRTGQIFVQKKKSIEQNKINKEIKEPNNEQNNIYDFKNIDNPNKVNIEKNNNENNNKNNNENNNENNENNNENNENNNENKNKILEKSNILSYNQFIEFRKKNSNKSEIIQSSFDIDSNKSVYEKAINGSGEKIILKEYESEINKNHIISENYENIIDNKDFIQSKKNNGIIQSYDKPILGPDEIIEKIKKQIDIVEKNKNKISFNLPEIVSLLPNNSNISGINNSSVTINSTELIHKNPNENNNYFEDIIVKNNIFCIKKTIL